VQCSAVQCSATLHCTEWHGSTTLCFVSRVGGDGILCCYPRTTAWFGDGPQKIWPVSTPGNMSKRHV